MQKHTPFQQKLRNHILTHSSLSVAEYMAACVEHYYATRDPFGQQGDFTTAPEISQVFGEIVGAWIAQNWLDSGAGEAILCELGPGRGTLMQDMLRATRNVPDFHTSIEICMVENSPVLIDMQRKRLAGQHSNITWHEVLPQFLPKPLLLVANEFFDALPVHQYVLSEGTEKERMVTCTEEGFCFIPEGTVCRETSPVSTAILRQVATHIHMYGGAAICIDYGYTTAPAKDTLQALRSHRYTDVLHNAGEVDITAHVDFGALVAAVKHMGITECPVVSQGDFLESMGGRIRLQTLCEGITPAQQKELQSGYERLVSPTQMGSLFKVLSFAEDGQQKEKR